MTFDNSYNPLNVRMAAEKYQHTARRLRENLIKPAACRTNLTRRVRQATDCGVDLGCGGRHLCLVGNYDKALPGRLDPASLIVAFSVSRLVRLVVWPIRPDPT